MKIFPAIDIKDKKCTYFFYDFKSEKMTDQKNIISYEHFSNDKFKYLHIIDLDGALTGKLINIKIIEEINNIHADIPNPAP